MSSVFSGCGLQLPLSPHHCTRYSTFFALWVFVHGLGAGINGSFSILGGEYYFYFHGIRCGGVDVLDLALHLLGCVRAYSIVTDCVFTLGGGWVLFCFCSTILVCVSGVSSLVFAMVCSWIFLPDFRSTSSFSVHNGENGADSAVFFSTLIVSVASWVAAPAE